MLDEPVAGLLDLGAGDVGGERLHRSGLEPVADDRAECERGTLDRAEPIEPRGEQGMDSRGKGVRRAPLADVGHELFEEEGIAAGCVAIRRSSSVSRRPPEIAASSALLDAAESGPSRRTAVFPMRRVQLARSSNGSGRVTRTRSTGTLRSRVATSSRSSTSAGSATWMSSTTMTSGRTRARAAISRGNAQLALRRPRLPRSPLSRPPDGPPTAGSRAWRPARPRSDHARPARRSRVTASR